MAPRVEGARRGRARQSEEGGRDRSAWISRMVVASTPDASNPEPSGPDASSPSAGRLARAARTSVVR
ncbi:hypothetical protein D3C74_461350 [compost metagenome]